MSKAFDSTQAPLGKMRKPVPTEKEIQAACLEWLNTIPGVRCWRQNTGGFPGEYKGKRRFTRFGQKGQSDISGVGPFGVRVEIEIKRPGKLPSDIQGYWLTSMQESGAVAFWADSLDTCVEQLRYEFIKRGWEWWKRWEVL